MRLFSTPEACELTGATYRQADHWSRTGVLVPIVDARGSGTARRYTLREVQALWVLRQLSTIAVASTSVLARCQAVDAVKAADTFAGYLVVTPGSAVMVPHVLALADLLTEHVASAVVQLDRCPVGQEVMA